MTLQKSTTSFLEAVDTAAINTGRESSVDLVESEKKSERKFSKVQRDAKILMKCLIFVCEGRRMRENRNRFSPHRTENQKSVLYRIHSSHT